MNTPPLDPGLPELGVLLRDAVDEIEPADRIETIRARTTGSPARAARPWFYAAGGVVLATAATVAAFALVGGSPAAMHDHEAATPTPGTQLVAVYFVGDTPEGDRLFREFDRIVGLDPVQGALDRIQQPPSDPDYRTPWPQGSLDSAVVRDGVIEVELGRTGGPDALAVEALTRTLQAAVGQRLPVELMRDGETVVEPSTPVPPSYRMLSRVMISDPAQGREVHAYFTARGVTPRGGEVRWEVRDEQDDVVATGVTGSGRSWEVRVDVDGLPFGSYTFVASVGRDSDTRTIIVR